jgi:cobyrinic acid a,c-diamide synthase
MTTPRIVIGGTNSGVGKTTVVAALCGAFRKLGLKVSVFKCGPDYLDPSYHLRAAATRSHTLDGWMMGREAVLSTFLNASRGTDIAVIEGVMGLFDGVEPASEIGSTAEIAKWLRAPVLLTIDASGMSRSVAAMALGFASFDSELHLAGVLCNRVGSRNHLDLLRAASADVPVLGGLPKDAEHAFPQRHLGLRTADEAALPDALFEAWATHAAEWCDLDGILALARSAPELASAPVRTQRVGGGTCRIGIARDDAFHFYYEENLRMLQQAGAELVPFSPMDTLRLPDVDGLYLGGGYPELRGGALAGNVTLRQDVLAFCNAGRPVYAECGGLMYLCESIRQTDGSRFPMVGWFAADAVMNSRMQALGYAEVVTCRDTVLGPVGQAFRGHQFRYSTLEWRCEPEHAYYLTRRRDGQRAMEGFCKGQVMGSYVHAHWASNPSIAKCFVAACQKRS